MLFIGLGATLLCAGGWMRYRYHGPSAEREIFHGITYGCERLPETDQSGGLLHWARADLNVPGVGLYVTPKDVDAMARGFEYKLKYTSTVVAENNLAVAVNGTMFTSDSSWIRLPGDLATSHETTVADHVMNHLDADSYLMWWADDSSGFLEPRKPPGARVLAAAKWGMSGQEPLLLPGLHSGNTYPDQRTAVAINPDKKLVWICCFDKASFQFISHFMEARGAIAVIAVDGGSSMSMAIGADAKNVRSGTVTGNLRPVATHFGFRATALP